MAIPKYDELQIPVMELLKENTTMRSKEFEEPLANKFNLSADEVAKMYDSGNGQVFYDRISWAISYLTMSGIITKPKRGVCELSEVGINLLKTPKDIIPFIDNAISVRDLEKKSQKTEKQDDNIDNDESDSTPQEKLYSSFNNIRKTVYEEILDTIMSKSPTEFEKIVVMLLQKMGYGGGVKDSGFVTRASNDGGIDGVIKEDILGLGWIHIQAKRYAKDNSVGREEIQKFVGALAVAQSNKGVFITTSRYSKGAETYAENLNGATSLVLIDGIKLAEYIYDFGLGLQVEQTIEIKKLDADFWDEMQDRND